MNHTDASIQRAGSGYGLPCCWALSVWCVNGFAGIDPIEARIKERLGLREGVSSRLLHVMWLVGVGQLAKFGVHVTLRL